MSNINGCVCVCVMCVYYNVYYLLYYILSIQYTQYNANDSLLMTTMCHANV